MAKENFISEYLSNESLDKISKSIANIEKKTSGEIRLCIKRKRGFLEKNHSTREIALNEFTKLGMDKTRDRTGVFMLIIFDEHKFEIIADEGINSKISQDHWDQTTGLMTGHFKNEKYLDGILYGIEHIGEILVKEFPIGEDDKNELPDDIVIG